jgi:hypothetical protein
MSTTQLLPYNEPRSLNQDAWFLYATSSIEYYEQCARLCEEFAHFFNTLITGHRAHGMAKVDYWVSCYLNHAENIRRGIEFVKTAGDYMPMLGFLAAPTSDYRGLIENAFGYEVREQWEPRFHPMRYACGTGAETLKNNEWAGSYWVNREQHRHEYELVDRDDGHVGSTDDGIRYAVQHGVLNPPQQFPDHSIDRSIKIRPGERCLRTGVWVPQQWLDGACDFSLAFSVEGRLMQPAFRIVALEQITLDDAFPEYDMAATQYVSRKTRAEDTTWYFAHKPDAATRTEASTDRTGIRLRCEAGQPCPREGWWFTPARMNSRRLFKAGELMPDLKSDWGITIWQWDEQQ